MTLPYFLLVSGMDGLPLMDLKNGEKKAIGGETIGGLYTFGQP
jgi:hypothetical protein